MVAATQIEQQRGVPGESEFYSLDDVLGRLGIRRTAGYILARRQEFPFKVHRIGRQYRISKVEFHQVMHGGADTADARVA